MTPEHFEEACLGFPGATVNVQWGEDRVFKVADKMFAVLGPAGSCSFAATDIGFEMLTETTPAIPAPYLARAKWVFFETTADIPHGGEDLLRAAYDRVVAKLPKKVQAGLRGGG